MPKPVKQRKRPSDENEIAFDLVRRSTQESAPAPPASIPSAVSQYMAQIGSKGGKIGGKKTNGDDDSRAKAENRGRCGKKPLEETLMQ